MPYFKCNLCGSHSKMEAMFKHLIGGAHTQNYVKLKFDVFPYLSSGDREKYTRILLDHEGSRIEDMRTIIGKQFYPYRWKNDVDPNFRKLFGDRTSRQIQSVDDGDHRGRNIGAARAFSKAVKETYTTRSDKLKKSRVDCTSLYSSCASLNSSDMAFEQIMLDGDDQIEKLMDHIYQEEKKEKGTDINPLQNEGYKVAAFKLMYILSVEEYEKTQADITKYDDSAQKMLLESHLKLLDDGSLPSISLCSCSKRCSRSSRRTSCGLQTLIDNTRLHSAAT
ncbi:uncharacterized protein [Procambarus clarkii]|uniref:uncharacterized protein isoform X1 n=1 Tax=Procambarus clarkii TaxID=6728 RepID=UPI003742B999